MWIGGLASHVDRAGHPCEGRGRAIAIEGAMVSTVTGTETLALEPHASAAENTIAYGPSAAGAPEASRPSHVAATSVASYGRSANRVRTSGPPGPPRRTWAVRRTAPPSRTLATVWSAARRRSARRPAAARRARGATGPRG